MNKQAHTYIYIYITVARYLNKGRILTKSNTSLMKNMSKENLSQMEFLLALDVVRWKIRK